MGSIRKAVEELNARRRYEGLQDDADAAADVSVIRDLLKALLDDEYRRSVDAKVSIQAALRRLTQ